MRFAAKAMLTMGLIGAAALATAAPSAAQYYSGPAYSGPGVRVYVGPQRNHHRYYRHRHHRYGYYVRGNSYTYNGCPPGYTVQSGRCKPYRGY
jgi:hypothetical protein